MAAPVFAAIIPARWASSRFPGKPLADIHGHPMVEHVWRRASALFPLCAVATDDGRIAEAVQHAGGQAIMTPANAASGTDRCAIAAEKAIGELGWKFDVVVNIQGDEPFVADEHLTLIQSCFSNPQVDIATLIKPISSEEELWDPNKPKVVVNNEGRALMFSRHPLPYARGRERGQWLEAHRYYRHIGMYAYRLGTLRKLTQLSQSPLELAESLEQLRWLENGYLIQTAVTEMESLSVDTPEDLQRALALGM